MADTVRGVGIAICAFLIGLWVAPEIMTPKIITKVETQVVEKVVEVVLYRDVLKLLIIERDPTPHPEQCVVTQ